MRCPVPLLTALWLAALPHVAAAQPTPPPSTELAPPEAAETKGQLPATEPAPATADTPAAPADSDAAPSTGDADQEGDEASAGEPEEPELLAKTMTAEQNELRARIEATQRAQPLDDSVQRPIDFARAALERSRASHVVGDTASEKRTQKLARAAVELADARLRLLRERALFSAARARRNVATAEIGIAQRALERERARARELERASAHP